MCWFNLFFVFISVFVKFGVNSEENVESFLEALQLRMSAIENRNMALQNQVLDSQNEIKILKQENQVLMSIVQESASVRGERETRSIKLNNI